MKLNRRLLPAGALTLALAALVVGAVVARDGLTQRANVLRDEAAAHEALAEANRRVSAAQRHSQWVDLAAHLVEQGRAQGLQPERWGERRVNLRAVSTSRTEADRLLRETAMNAEHLFVAETYEISVLEARDSFFHAPSEDDRGLNLSLRGSFYARDPEKK